MKVLIIDNYDSFTFNLRQIVEECGTACDIVKNDQIDVNEIQRYQKILISPGPGVPSEAGKLPLLLKTFHRDKSILGICLGHQAIAEFFGAKLILLPMPSHGIKKRMKLVHKGSPLFDHLPDEIEGGLYHSWAVSPEHFPECLRVTATAPDGTIMALSHYEYDIHGIQFHPESVMTSYGKMMIDNWLQRERWIE